MFEKKNVGTLSNNITYSSTYVLYRCVPIVRIYYIHITASTTALLRVAAAHCTTTKTTIIMHRTVAVPTLFIIII